MQEYVVLVTPQDEPVGLMEKMAAHENGLLHRAFSVFLFDSEGRMLLQQRAAEKYHSPGLWTNTCCSHPREGESYLEAAERRLVEELGITTDLLPAFSFIYKAEVGEGLWEHELDHVFVGRFDGEIKPNPTEVADTMHMTLEEIAQKMAADEQYFTQWFKIIWHQHHEKIEAAKQQLFAKG